MCPTAPSSCPWSTDLHGVSVSVCMSVRRVGEVRCLSVCVYVSESVFLSVCLCKCVYVCECMHIYMYVCMGE